MRSVAEAAWRVDDRTPVRNVRRSDARGDGRDAEVSGSIPSGCDDHGLMLTMHVAPRSAVDRLESELMSELENARLVRLLCKFGFINERPE